jgi:hypothetical protein
MDVSLTLQYMVIAAAVLVSAGVVMKKQFPVTTRRLRVAVALSLLGEGRAPWMRRLGRSIAPPSSGRVHACGGCSSCGPSEPSRR